MRLTIFQRPFLCQAILSLFLSLTACQPAVKPPSVSRENILICPPVQLPENEVSEKQSTLERNPASAISEFWDVSDVDISYVQTDKKYIAFTFDDAPARTLERILGVFTAYNEQNSDCPASATLFCNGNRVDETQKGVLHWARTLQFELGNHTFSHKNLLTLSPAELALEIEKTDKILQSVDGKPAHLFRAPYGNVNDEVKRAVCAPVVSWTIDTLDWTGRSAEKIYQAVWENKFSGAIVLMHDGYEETVSALKRLLPDLKEAGYQVLSVSAMAKANACPLRNGGVYIRARKNGKS